MPFDRDYKRLDRENKKEKAEGLAVFSLNAFTEDCGDDSFVDFIGEDNEGVG